MTSFHTKAESTTKPSNFSAKAFVLTCRWIYCCVLIFPTFLMLSDVRISIAQNTVLGEEIVPTPAKVIATFRSATIDADGRGATVQYQILSVLEQPNRMAKPLELSTVLSERYTPNESRFPVSQQIQIYLKNKLWLMEVIPQDGGLVPGPFKWPLEASNLEAIRITESQGAEDVRRIRQRATLEGRVQALAALAQSTKYPSLMLVLEARSMVEFKTPDDLRFQLFEALAVLLQRDDAPDYVRQYAYEIAEGLPGGRDRTTGRILLSKVLIGVFHREAQQTKDLKFVRIVLDNLMRSIVSVVSETELQDLEKQLVSDLKSYQAKILAMDGEKVELIKREIDGKVVYGYSGSMEKAGILLPAQRLLDFITR